MRSMTFYSRMFCIGIIGCMICLATFSWGREGTMERGVNAAIHTIDRSATDKEAGILQDNADRFYEPLVLCRRMTGDAASFLRGRDNSARDEASRVCLMLFALVLFADALLLSARFYSKELSRDIDNRPSVHILSYIHRKDGGK